MTTILALDAMGGDVGPKVVVEGAAIALSQSQGPLSFLLFGDGPLIEAQLDKFPGLRKYSTIVHTDVLITNDTKPSTAVRMGRKSNLGMAVDAVAKGQAHAVVSAGNTGAYMALSKILLKTLKGIDRPAIPAVLPTIKGKTVVLDLGANIDCSAESLVQFALMGEAFSREILKLAHPTVGLLNIGSEDLKGNATVQKAAQLLKDIEDFNFSGFVEGNDITAGTTDVVVTDGFSGNVALKSIEGAAHLIKHLLEQALSSSWLGKLGYLIARSSFKQFKGRIDPRLYNGAVFLGLRHIAVKSHGGTDTIGFANAIGVAIQMVQSNLVDKIEQRLNLGASLQSVGPENA
ncbi:phosphate acyltransferase PlsX [Candidatus Finniella inopinata]|uniref:Phosphate acyltransferase n=1 Tax=Candidatus Finniella inopinata TaxID=1696036 RepID=A0A4Q7DFD0_9PROT|nr:phosphate acyltransferase PlsX [Candidatus Finniella inopinata]RZI45342.1 phosphate acyltransferase PlsX [Candidatus Finniella inopinata]